MRTRLLSGTVAALVLGTLLLPATAQASAPALRPRDGRTRPWRRRRDRRRLRIR